VKRLILAVSLLLCGFAAWSQETAAKPMLSQTGDRWLFPRNFVRGYLDFQVAPPHNEVELGLCMPGDGIAAGQTARCGGYARYIWSGYIEFQPVGRGPLRRVFFFMEPKLFGGDNLPQQSYTASASPILWERSLGAAIELPRGFELRTQTHRTMLLGRYGAKPTAVTGLPHGPYGLHSTVGVRWRFGGYGRASTAE
jgi:hypothetical protein